MSSSVKKSENPPKRRSHEDDRSSLDKWMIAFVAGILFFLLATPYLFDMTNSASMWFMNLQLTNGKGAPNMAGVMVHAILFILIVRFLLIGR